ncbi:MAG: transcriptional repressor [Pseudomonadota bacterium]
MACHKEHQAAHTCSPPEGLGKNELLVWETLSHNDKPMKAYEILDDLKSKGVRAPMTVYRALDSLTHRGFIHKLEGRNAFVICSHGGPHEVEAFLLCDKCDKVSEISTDGLDIFAAPDVRGADFQVMNAKLEIRGICSECKKSEKAA